MYEIQDSYQKAIRYAATKHLEGNQTIKGTRLPYVVHLSNVAMELLIASGHTPDFDLNYAIQTALLHDTIEDTSTTLKEIEEIFGNDIATGVLALTKDETLPKDQHIWDSLVRIKKLRKEVWAVKLADRITNLQSPPDEWDNVKIKSYKSDSELILKELQEGNKYLADRLRNKISTYNYNRQPEL